MKLYVTLFIGLLLVLTLTGCIGEDYDVGVPTAHLYIESLDFQLTEANSSWKTESEDVQGTIEDVQTFALAQNEIEVSANQEAAFDFKENKKNGGDIWTDPEITAVLLTDKERIELMMNDFGEFTFPAAKGNYALLVEFESTAGKAQYAGNILIQ